MKEDDVQKLINLIWDEIDPPKGENIKTLILGLEKKVAENDFTIDLIKEFVSILKVETLKFPDEWAEIKKEILQTVE